jgi:DNA-binding transcriptional LysR family regulator
MDARSLHYFVLVASHGSFSRAAGFANATQSTLSKAVANLEAFYGTSLLVRTRAGVRLTEAGQIVLPHARAILGEFDLMRAELDVLAGLERGELRLGIGPIGSNVLFAQPLATYRERFPNITISLTEHGSKQLQAMLVHHEIDVAATMLPLLPGLQSQMVIAEPLLAVIADGHPLAAGERLCLDSLDSEPLLLFAEGFALNDLIAKVLRERGIEPLRTISGVHVDFILALASVGVGIALLPKTALQGRLLRGVVTLPTDEPALRWTTVLAWRREGFLPQAAREWLEIARSQMAL